MKRNLSKKQSKSRIAHLAVASVLTIIIAISTLIGTALYYTKNYQAAEEAPQGKNDMSKNPKPQPEEPTKNPQNKSSKAKTSSVITIKLPNAQPITARKSNYSNDSDIWKIVNKKQGFNQPDYRANDTQVVPVATLSGRGQDERSMRQVTFGDLEAMFIAAKNSGVHLKLGSGYRSYSTQKFLFSRYAKQYGEAQASTFSSRPGHSEHQSGLAADLVGSDGSCWVDECFENTSAGKWLNQNAHKYGFILRYPKGKQAITGYKYEPWHFRYVGKDLAIAIKQSGLTLEEVQPYLETASKQLRDLGQIK